ncbi:glycosyltransferase family 4 protein [Chryseobacterium sp. JAH]|uniref:glycosyltransferase family 4 protein n=1 Tax=Chryseobacterium sp. JAH TaxID=1742858 RepID=UPI0007413065|nr:glycosyltransferase family 4 protein [Chryseobacterium sp. JAH]KUJ50600.1 hypothetical protein AR685_15005 [Chryseobacterium sp. JAH]
MNIIFLEAVQDYGGARISTVELAQRLSEKHNVKMLDFYGSCKAFVEDIEIRNISLEVIEQRDKPYIINTSKSLPLKLINYFLFVPHWWKMRKETIKRIKRLEPDFVIINNFKVLSALMFFPAKNFKTLFFARGWFIPAQISTIESKMLKKWIDNYLCVSQATKNALFAGGFASLENLYVVPNAINETKISKEKAKISKGPNTTVILHAGGFLKDKGQLVSLEAAKILKERGVDFKLLLVGIIYKGGESEIFYNQVKQIIARDNLENYVEIVLNKPNVISYFNTADILIHPSETEGLPRVIMEAMILKKPVIANAVGGVTDYILNGFTGFLPHHNSSLEYVKYIEALINNKELYEQISSNAYNLVSETYTEQNQLESLFRVFES